MEPSYSFDDRVKERLGQLSPSLQRVVHYFQEHREEVLIASASRLAAETGVSDATVIRTTRALGFSGMDELRRSLARELRENQSPASRMAGTLSEIGDDLETAFDTTLDIHRKSLENLRRDVTVEHFREAVEMMSSSKRIGLFGMGPSSAMATYFETQLGRIGVDAYSLTHSGLLLADDLQELRPGDLLIIFSYSRVYRELEVLLKQAEIQNVSRILVTDSLGATLSRRVDLVLNVARGKTGMISMHTATLGLIETLLVGLATVHPVETLASLRRLNRIRADLAGKSMKLPDY